ncbi:hypothetical protein [Actinocorallia sp. A-T 12471]|uniref:YqeB family protein n=1 Tax=Actinocorallia sp. A-T 12471 TaxID=3089813 RepID=UPI0029CADA37|nr:hypothetical protein [Actinocorallia sp. A-T 12471]MDX6739349.1 hypothetical protein [Actinocorallia sp. A-T 12471]
MARTHRSGLDGRQKETVVAEPRWAIALLCAAAVAGGGGLGWLVGPLGDWWTSLPWAPWQGPVETLLSFPDPWRTLVPIVIGLVAGGFLALMIHTDLLAVAVSADRVALTRDGKRTEYAAADLRAAFRDGKYLVLLANDGRELARERTDLDAEALEAAFTAYGHAWAEADPHAADFVRWAPGAPGLPAGADAYFTAREKALRKDRDGSDARELRAELARLGLVVRETDHRQYWRPTAP